MPCVNVCLSLLSGVQNVILSYQGFVNFDKNSVTYLMNIGGADAFRNLLKIWMVKTNFLVHSMNLILIILSKYCNCLN